VVTSINLKNQGVASFLLIFLDRIVFLVDLIDDFLTIPLQIRRVDYGKNGTSYATMIKRDLSWKNRTCIGLNKLANRM
jgi:hypothetical protein